MAEILVLDDVLDAAVLIKKILEKKGHRVHIHTKEEDALALARQNHLDLAILDMKLTQMEGLEVLAELRELQPAIPAIVLTGYPTLDSAWRSREMGVLAYCVKPVDKKELEDSVAAALTRSGQARNKG